PTPSPSVSFPNPRARSHGCGGRPALTPCSMPSSGPSRGPATWLICGIAGRRRCERTAAPGVLPVQPRLLQVGGGWRAGPDLEGERRPPHRAAAPTALARRALLEALVPRHRLRRALLLFHAAVHGADRNRNLGKQDRKSTR